MNIEDVIELERQLEAQLADMEKIRAKLDAVRLTRATWEEMNNQKVLTHVIEDDGQDNATNGAPSLPREYGNIAETVREAVNGMTSTFKFADVEGQLIKNGYKFVSNSIRTVLMRMRKNGQIRVVKKGRGRIPAIFTVVQQPQAAQ